MQKFLNTHSSKKSEVKLFKAYTNMVGIIPAFDKQTLQSPMLQPIKLLLNRLRIYFLAKKFIKPLEFYSVFAGDSFFRLLIEVVLQNFS